MCDVHTHTHRVSNLSKLLQTNQLLLLWDTGSKATHRPLQYYEWSHSDLFFYDFSTSCLAPLQFLKRETIRLLKLLRSLAVLSCLVNQVIPPKCSYKMSKNYGHNFYTAKKMGIYTLDKPQGCYIASSISGWGWGDGGEI